MAECVKNKRDGRFDFYKGLLIIGVVFGHMITALRSGASSPPPWIHAFLRTYDMPMFAFITGIFLNSSCNKRNTWQNLLNKITAILLPTLIWEVISSVLHRSFSLAHYWYLWATMICSCVVICIHGITKKTKVFRLILFILAIIVFHLPHVSRYNAGFLITPCIVGYYYHDIAGFFENRKLTDYAKIAVVVAFVVLQCFWTTDYNVWNTGCNIFSEGTPLYTGFKMLYRGAIGLCGCFTMKIFFDAIYDSFNKSSLMSKIVQGCGILGQSSMEIYILQAIVVEYFGAAAIRKFIEIIGKNPFVFNTDFLGWIIAPAFAIISVIVCYYIQKLLHKIPIVSQFVFGGTIQTWKKMFEQEK